MLEVYISCRACPWENVLRSGPRSIVELEEDVEKLTAKVNAGVPLEQVLAARKQRLEQERLKHNHSG